MKARRLSGWEHVHSSGARRLRLGESTSALRELGGSDLREARRPPIREIAVSTRSSSAPQGGTASTLLLHCGGQRAAARPRALELQTNEVGSRAIVSRLCCRFNNLGGSLSPPQRRSLTTTLPRCRFGESLPMITSFTQVPMARLCWVCSLLPEDAHVVSVLVLAVLARLVPW